MESRFPGFTLKKVEVDDGGKGVEVEKRLDVWNTLIKFGLDQTVGAVVNVALYLGGTRLLRGVPPVECWQAVQEVCALYQTTNYANVQLSANVASDESWIQAVASC